MRLLLAALLLLLVAGAGCGSDDTVLLGGGADAPAADAPDAGPADAEDPDAGAAADADGALSDAADAGEPMEDAALDTARPDDVPAPDDVSEPEDAGVDGTPDIAPDTEPEDTMEPTDAGLPPEAGADTQEPPRLFDVAIEATSAFGGWAEVERCYVDHDALVPERLFIAKTRHTDDDVIAAFGGDNEPPSGRFLLHAAPGWQEAAGRPVLLLHGAGSEATQSFMAPDVLGSDPGLATVLSGADRPTFAVTFAARYGDNTNQAIVVAAALQRVREKTGARRVDIVAHSKGGLAALPYLVGMLAEMGVPYGDDAGNVLLLGVPLGGMDFSFRHPNFNYSSSAWGLELPSSWDQALLWGLWQDTTEESIYGGAYDGELQSLARWDEVHALSMTEQDWYTTYEGGQGFVSHSLGIDAAIEMGGNFMARLRSFAAPAGMRFAVLVGTNPYVGLTAWELTGPSDCLVFTASAGDTDWLVTDGAVVATKDEVGVNHWELLHDEEARAWVLSALSL